MKKLLLTLTVSVAVAYSTFAQSTTSEPGSSSKGGAKFSIGAEGGLPIGDAATLIYNTVIGGSLKCELPTSNNTYFTISAGYNSFLVKSIYRDSGDGFPSSSGFLPLKAGIKGYFGSGFFLEGQAGIVFSTDSGGGHSFAWSAGAGYSFNGGLEAGIRYEDWTNTPAIGQVSLRLAYRF